MNTECRGRFYVKGFEVWKQPIQRKHETGGGFTVTIGFPVCTVHEAVGLQGALAIAAALNLAEHGDPLPPNASD